MEFMSEAKSPEAWLAAGVAIYQSGYRNTSRPVGISARLDMRVGISGYRVAIFRVWAQFEVIQNFCVVSTVAPTIAHVRGSTV